MTSGRSPAATRAGQRSIVLLRRLLVLVTSWHLADTALASRPGAIASSSAVIVFGVCSFALLLGSLVVLWRLSPAPRSHRGREETAERLVGLSFYLVAAVAAAWAVLGVRRTSTTPRRRPLDIAAAIPRSW